MDEVETPANFLSMSASLKLLLKLVNPKLKLRRERSQKVRRCTRSPIAPGTELASVIFESLKGNKSHNLLPKPGRLKGIACCATVLSRYCSRTIGAMQYSLAWSGLSNNLRQTTALIGSRLLGKPAG